MKNPTPTNSGDSHESGAGGTENTGAIEVAGATPKIDTVIIEGSGKLTGIPEQINVTITYTTDSDGVMDLQSTLILSVDENNVAHIDEIEGDGTMAEWFIPMMYVKQELSQQHPAIDDVAGVPSFGVVHDQLYDNQPQFNEGQPQLKTSGYQKQGSQPSLPESSESEPDSSEAEEMDAPAEQNVVKNGSSSGESKAVNEDSEASEESSEDDEDNEDDNGDSVEVEVEDAKTDADSQNDEEDLTPESLIADEESDWVVDDSSGEGNILATIKNEVTEWSITIWDFRDEEDAPKNYGLHFYDGGEKKQLGFDDQDKMVKKVEEWKADPPQVS